MQMPNTLLSDVKRRTKLLLSMVRRPWMTADRLAGGLTALGVRPGGVLMVHSSLKSLGFVPGGPETVIAGLRKALGPEGTLVMPTHTWEWMGKGLRTFDAQKTPSCVGTITEVFRGLPGVVRSLHPTHSVAAIGARADWIVEGHENAATPCGEGTPYAKVIEEGGQILFLGCGLDRNTAFHTLEALANVPYFLRTDAETFELIDARGESIERTLRRHQEHIPRRFREMEPTLAEAGALVRGQVGPARCLVVDSRKMCDVLLPKLAQDPQLMVAAK